MLEAFIIREMATEDIPEIYRKLHLKYVEKYCKDEAVQRWNEYETWYNFILNSPYFKMYIIRNKNDEFISIIKFEIIGSGAIINIYIDQNMRNKGLASMSIKKGIERLLEERKIKWIDAYILKENDISKHIFEKLGFEYKKNANYNGVRHKVYRRVL